MNSLTVRSLLILGYAPLSELKRMFVHTYCIACHQKHQKQEYWAKDHILSARIVTCGNCTRRRRFQHLLCRRNGIIGLAITMALMNPSYNFMQYEYIAIDEWYGWPLLNQDIHEALCYPMASIFKQTALAHIFRRFKSRWLA
jgi:threonine dehydrogenase-like Zn-dependent dehydrogenase